MASVGPFFFSPSPVDEEAALFQALMVFQIGVDSVFLFLVAARSFSPSPCREEQAVPLRVDCDSVRFFLLKVDDSFLSLPLSRIK